MSEPTLKDIDDYEDKESVAKRRAVWAIVILLLAIGAIFATMDKGSAKTDLIQTVPKD